MAVRKPKEFDALKKRLDVRMNEFTSFPKSTNAKGFPMGLACDY